MPIKSEPEYLNIVGEFKTDLDPIVILESIQKIEKDMGRKRTADRWGRRPCDIDILAYGNHIYPNREIWHSCSDQAPEIPLPPLVTPHPRLHKRSFILKPLAEILPYWRHPVLGHSTNIMLNQLPIKDFEGIRILQKR